MAVGVESSQFGNDSYNSVKTKLTGYRDSQGEVTFVFSALTASKLTGLPALTGDADSATAYFDDSAFDITVIFDTTYLEQDVQVLISARWTNGALDFEPEMAVVLRIDAIDLTSLNANWDAFPVNVSSVLVGFSNVDHTLVEVGTMGTDGFFEDGIPDAPTAPDNPVRIIPGGAGLRAGLDDDPDGADPLLEGAGLLGVVDKIVIRGSAGKIPGAEEEQENYVQAREYYREALADLPYGPVRAKGILLADWGIAEYWAGDLERANDLFAEAAGTSWVSARAQASRGWLHPRAEHPPLPCEPGAPGMCDRLARETRARGNRQPKFR